MDVDEDIIVVFALFVQCRGSVEASAGWRPHSPRSRERVTWAQHQQRSSSGSRQLPPRPARHKGKNTSQPNQSASFSAKTVSKVRFPGNLVICEQMMACHESGVTRGIACMLLSQCYLFSPFFLLLRRIWITEEQAVQEGLLAACRN